MIEAAKFVLRKDTDDFKQARVAVTAPTAIAAKLCLKKISLLKNILQHFRPCIHGRNFNGGCRQTSESS